MAFLRRILGVFVMIAGIVGILLSLAGLVGVWMAKPVLTTSINSIVDTLNTSVETSKNVMTVTNDALGATVNSVDALSEVLGTTADTLGDTQPVIIQVTGLMSDTLPSALQAATDSLGAAEEAAKSLEGAIVSFEAFRGMIAAMPLIGSTIPLPETVYNPDKPLSDSLGELAVSMQDMPSKFEEMSTSLDSADDNLGLIQTNLETMSENVSFISGSLEQYRSMIGESQSSMDQLQTMLTNIQNNSGQILNIAMIVFVVFFLWLLAAQVVIFSQGWELFNGTAGRMDTGAPKAVPTEAESAS
jgi:methyl-accepting chemotaxis protein